MGEILSNLGWIALGLIIGAGMAAAVNLRCNTVDIMAQAAKMAEQFAGGENVAQIATLMQSHFAASPLSNLTISERKFPFRVRADLQLAIDHLFSSGTTIGHFCGVRKEYSHQELALADCVVVNEHGAAVSIPPKYEEVNIGDEEPVRCLKNGLWLLEGSIQICRPIGSGGTLRSNYRDPVSDGRRQRQDGHSDYATILQASRRFGAQS